MFTFELVKGKTIVEVVGLKKQEESVTLKLDDKSELEFYHEYSCCENVWLEDFEFSGKSIIGAKILDVILVSERQDDTEWGTMTWTFYKVQTDKGELFMRWCGESNGYYSEDVDIKYTSPEGEVCQHNRYY